MSGERLQMGLGTDGRAARRTRAALLGVLLTLMVLTSFSQTPARAASPSPPVATNIPRQIHIDAQQFVTTVPAYAQLGTNYTLRVVVRSNATISVPLIIQVTAPVGAIFTHPRVVRTDIPPNGFTVANFSMVPFASPNTGPYFVKALVFVFFPLSMSVPLLVDQVSGTVVNIGPNPFPYLEVTLVFALVVAVVLVVFFNPWILRRLAGRSGQQSF
jgi:hypothetical protein